MSTITGLTLPMPAAASPATSHEPRQAWVLCCTYVQTDSYCSCQENSLHAETPRIHGHPHAARALSITPPLHLAALIGDLHFDSSLRRVRGDSERFGSFVEREAVRDEWFQVDETARDEADGFGVLSCQRGVRPAGAGKGTRLAWFEYRYRKSRTIWLAEQYPKGYCGVSGG